MAITIAQLEQKLAERAGFLGAAEEALAGRTFELTYGGDVVPARLDLPKALQTANTRVIEIFNADWSNPDTVAGVVAYLDQLCEFWENIIGAHNAAVTVFGRAMSAGTPYCLYLRSFSQVASFSIGASVGRAVAFVNDERLDRNVAGALASHGGGLTPVTCAHTDDLALLEGRWVLPAFRVHNHDWKPVVRAAIAASKVIVFYIGQESAGVRYELDEIVRSGMARRTIVVHEGDVAPPGHWTGFADLLPLSNVVRKDRKGDGYDLTARASSRLDALAGDDYRPPRPAAVLAGLSCGIVDPQVPDGAVDAAGAARPFFVTASNITAFAWYVEGFPAAVEIWNRIARGLFREKRAPSDADMAAMQRNAIMASVGAAALGLTSSLAAIIAMRTIFANVIQVPDPDRRAARKGRFLQLLEIADRFDALTERRAWKAQIEQWRDVIQEDAFS